MGLLEEELDAGNAASDKKNDDYDISDESDDVSEKQGLAQSLSSRHLLMFSVGATIGMGFWLGTGSILRSGGPAAIFLGFCLAGIIAFTVNQAVGELAILYPLPSAFPQWTLKLVDVTPAFTCGWAYWFCAVVTLANELQSCNTVLQYWTDAVPTAAWISIFIVVLFIIAVSAVEVFGEVEVILSAVKLFWIAVVIISFIVISAGGAPNHHKTGFEYWNSMPFTNGFKGFLSVMATCITSMSGTEIVGLAAAEAKNPKASVGRAVNSTWIRLTVFYVMGALMVSITVSPMNEKIFGGSGTDGSPFVIAYREANLPGLAHAMNAIIFVSVISSGNGQAYTGTRTLVGMANLGLAPKFLAKCDRRGVPWFAAIATFVVGGGLSYLNVSNSGGTVFSWFSSLTSLCILWVWGTIFICHLRFRAAWKAQGRTPQELPWRTVFWPYGTVIGLTLCVLLIVVQFYLAIWPLHKPTTAENFFATFISIVVLVVLFCLAKLWFRGPLFKRAKDIDLVTGMVEYGPDEEDTEASGAQHEGKRLRLRKFAKSLKR
ncbi:Amino acid/polyamine transporter I [Ascosphaera apis ARSEF 7405]|uniref:Amino acid/polyamine transporter I n=1 Tax=Ascosphaera apis ARSEF 7405 TaxID=392613 RepID=A0A162I819_9EURO|nr:Amino acid/polyamine transporter I [Ascosphaera apis ARSEF 7405]